MIHRRTQSAKTTRFVPPTGRCLAAACVAMLLLASPVEAQTPTGPDAALALQQSLVDAIAKAEKSVVAIARVRKDQPRFGPMGATVDPTSPDFIPQEYGTGVVLDRNGLILTNYHVLGDPAKFDYYVWVNHAPFEVTRVERAVQVTAADPWTDLAMLKIEADDLHPIALGDAKELKKGMLVVALGNPYAIARDGEASATWGIISNLARKAPPHSNEFRASEGKETLHHFGTLIQTDARLPQGTSGGALINLQGEMIGLTTSLAGQASYDQSAGFAIPVDDVFRRVLDELKAGRAPAFGFLGVSTRDREPAERRRGNFGARVDRVVENTPAARAGLRPGDVIVRVKGRPIYDRNDLFRELSQLAPDSAADLTILRDAFGTRGGREMVRTVKLSKKYVDTARPTYATYETPAWRGMKIEYVTALPPSQFFQPQAFVVNRADAVGVLDVERDSAAWRAGFRPGELITHVGNEPVTTPKEFWRAVDGKPRTVAVRVLDSRGEGAARTVAP